MDKIIFGSVAERVLKAAPVPVMVVNPYKTPIKHIYRKNQRIFGVGLANYLILLIPKFLGGAEARKIWCGKYLLLINKFYYFVDLYDK
jgi:hypothetical protein